MFRQRLTAAVRSNKRVGCSPIFSNGIVGRTKQRGGNFTVFASLSEDELLDERAAISKLVYVERLEEGKRKTPLDRYSFPVQDTDLSEEDKLCIPPDGAKFGSVAAIDIVRRTLDIKKRRDQADAHPKAVFTHSIVPSQELAAALIRIAEDVIERGIEADGQYRAARDLLLGKPPRLSSGAFSIDGRENQSNLRCVRDRRSTTRF